MCKMQKRQVGCFILVVLSLSVVASVSLAEFLKSPREKYRSIDFEKPSSWEADFLAEYQKAVAQDDDWIKDAKTVALRVAGYPNDDNIPPANVNVETTQDDKIIVTVLSQKLMDDSISRIETRVELVQDGDIWKIIWAGWRQQCARGSLGFDWTTSFCP